MTGERSPMLRSALKRSGRREQRRPQIASTSRGKLANLPGAELPMPRDPWGGHDGGEVAERLGPHERGRAPVCEEVVEGQ